MCAADKDKSVANMVSSETLLAGAAALGTFLAVGHVYKVYLHMEAVTLCHPATWCANS